MSRFALCLLLLVTVALPASAQHHRRRYYVPASSLQVAPGYTGQPASGISALPACIHSSYVGPPGDAVSQGRFYAGNQVTGGGGFPGSPGHAIGISTLPKVRNSAYMGTPGDGIRSDMGRTISGARNRQVPAGTITGPTRLPHTNYIYSYPEYRAPSDYGSIQQH